MRTIARLLFALFYKNKHSMIHALLKGVIFFVYTNTCIAKILYQHN